MNGGPFSDQKNPVMGGGKESFRCIPGSRGRLLGDRYSQVGEPLTKKKNPHRVLFVLLSGMLTFCRMRLQEASLVVQWLRLPTFPMQGALVLSLVKELDP